MTLLLLGGGLALLLGGAELFVRGASRLAAVLGVSALAIGLTVVACGTSAPEIAVSIAATRRGQPAIALGNVVGSNICNVLLILGLTALITPLTVARRLVRLEVPLVIGVSLGVFALAATETIPRWAGAMLLGLGVVYTVLLARAGRRQPEEIPLLLPAPPTNAPPAQPEVSDRSPRRGGRIVAILLLIAGLSCLLLGSRWLVAGAVDLARTLGVSELVIGLTVVSVGTSLPEIATCVLAGLRGQGDLAVGNVLGSNLFNLLIVLGLAALVSPSPIPVDTALLRFDLPVMLGAAIACLPVCFTGHLVNRWEGAMFLIYYLAYLVYLLLDSRDHDALPAFSAAMLWFALPLTALGLIASVLRPRAGVASANGQSGPSNSAGRL